MRWCFVSSDPLTTEAERYVEDAAGRAGKIRIRHVHGRPEAFGPVRDDFGTVLDAEPELVSDHERL